MNKLPIFEKGESGGINFQPENSLPQELILLAYLLIIFAFFSIIFIRLFQLTITKGQYYRNLSENNRIRELIIEPKRGKIIDRKGFEIAKNLPAEVTKKINPRITSSRLYFEPEAIAPLVGYRQIADQEDFKNDSCLNKLKLADKVGKKGVEKIFDCQLRGKAGKKLIEVDARGKFLRELTIIPPVEGKTIQLAADLLLQKTAYEILKEKRGAIIALNPKNGEILTLVSSPSFSPQDFEESKTESIQKYLSDKNQPLFNRATAGLYPPGSIFKLIVAAAALEEKAIDASTLIEDTGVIQAGPFKFGNWYFLEYGKTEGMVDVIKAIKRSNDIYFYKVGEKTGVEKIKIWADRFGFEKTTGVGLEEKEGLVPSPFWKKEKLKEDWYLGDSYNFSIGQGYLSVTPLQVALATAIFANGGYLCRPQLIKIKNQNSKITNCQKIPLSQKTLSLIKEGMRQACSPGGTGWPLFNFSVKTLKEKEESQKIEVACKTGTAESQSKNSPPHSWFTVFAPYNDPEIVLTVLVENGGQGADVAGPIAKEILKAYFERRE